MKSAKLSYLQGVAMFVGLVLGTGVLILPGHAANIAGPASLVSWLALCLLSVPLVYALVRLAIRYNDFGGVATIVRQAFGRTPGALIGWFYFVWVAIGWAPVSLTGAGYLGAPLGWSRDAVYLFALGFTVIPVVLNLGGLKVSGNASLVFSAVVLVMLVATIVFAVPHVEGAAFEPFAPHGVPAIGSAAVLVFWAFLGWESLTSLVPEFRRPRDVMRATWTALVIVAVVYLALAFVTIGTRTYGTTKGNDAPLTVLMNKSLGVSAGVITGVVACIVVAGVVNVYLASAARLGYALASEGTMPAWLGAVSRRGVPYRSTIFFFVTTVGTLAVGYFGEIDVNKMILGPVTLGIFIYVFVTLACVKLLWTDPVGRWASIIAAVCCLIVVPFSAQALLAPILVSAACLLYLRLTRSRRAALDAEAEREVAVTTSA
ncbi:APC family permease [Longispora albida]|uniref:APC family permease n=1 Tax=Longispora albida TaxID=203523 RepID=UPI0003A72061|nr:amino acid permease [Longispora albida]